MHKVTKSSSSTLWKIILSIWSSYYYSGFEKWKKNECVVWMTVQFIMLWLAKENHHHEKSNKRHSQQRHNCWSQWNAEFCLCAQHSTKQINTSEIETGIYKQISLYLIMSQQHVINHWEVNCSPPCKKKSLFDLGDKFGFVKLIATTTQTVWGPEGPSFTWDKKLQGRWLRSTMITWCYL